MDDEMSAFTPLGAEPEEWQEAEQPAEDTACPQQADENSEEEADDEGKKEPIKKNGTKDFTGANAISLSDLMGMQLPPVQWVIIKRMSKPGLVLLVGPPKMMKSWMALEIAIDVASGHPFLGCSTVKCDVLYLALEDSFMRIKDRMSKLIEGKEVPDNCTIQTIAPKLDDGLIDTLTNHLHEHPATGLIIIDTLQQVRGFPVRGEGQYASDYRELSTLKKFADEHGICVLVIHHTRKLRDDNDPFNEISGTNGIMGVADTVWMLHKENRDDEDAILSITGRDVVQDDLSVRFNENSCRWELVGRTKEIAERKEREAYEKDPLVQTIRYVVNHSSDKVWKGSMKDLLNAGKDITHISLADNERQLASMVGKLDSQLIKFDTISHRTLSHGSGGATHVFELNHESKVVTESG